MRTVLGRGHLVQLALAALLSALTCLSAIALMGTSAWLISRAAQHPDASSLTLAAVAVRALGISRAVLRYGERLVSHDVVLRRVADLRSQVFDALRRAPEASSAGDDVTVLVSDVEAVQDLWLRAVLPVAAAALVAAASVGAVWVILPAAGLVLAAGLGAALVLLPLLAWWASGGDRLMAGWRAERQSAVVDLLHGCGELLVYGGAVAATRRAMQAITAVSSLERRAARRAAVLGGLGVVVQGTTALVVALVAARAVVQDGLEPVWVGVVVLVALAAFEPAASVSDAAGVARVTSGALARVRRALAVPVEVPPAVTEPPAGVVRVAGLDHRFAGRTRDALHVPALALLLAPGRAVGVVGGSGAGKSTLLRLLVGELRCVQGSVSSGGTELSDLSPEQRSTLVAVAAQDAHVFDSTLADNLRVGRPEATPAELEQALAVVGLDGWAAGLSDGMQTQLGHRGVRLSGGQGKRLCVARAWLSRRPVLLLDEPTEGLDPDAADALVASVLAASADRAVVLVTHRVVSLDAVDEVLVLDHGLLVQRGPAAQLVGEPGLFGAAWRLQGGNLPETLASAG